MAGRFLCFTLFFSGVLALFFLAKRHFKSPWWALLCCTLLVLTPRIFAPGFYNSRDIPELTLFTLSIFLITFAIATVAVWPFLWEQPIRHFLDAYAFMSSHGEGPFEFLGHTYDGFPLLYIPVWMVVTIPLVYTLFFVVGASAIIIRSMRGILRSSFRTVWLQHRTEILFLAWFFGPIAAILITGAGIYLEWRHIYFVYPALILTAITGLRFSLSMTRSRVLRHTIWIILMFQCASTGIWMLRNHPFEYVYFSIPTRFTEGYFPLDYWAVSYKQIAAELLAREMRPVFSVYSDENVAFINFYNFFPEALDRVAREHDIAKADYVVTRDPALTKRLLPVKELTVDGLVINGIYRGP